MVVVGQKIIIHKMAHRTKNEELKNKLTQVIDLLKLILILDDKEISKSTIESIIELLEEEISK